MKNIILKMIGNSHIDPVWFWCKEEGMQEVKATFLSALARMREYPDFVFTSGSSAFYEYMEEHCPAAFEEIKQRVKEGRWEVAGGWYLEADACLPCGESMIRQALYAQKYYQKTFGKISKIAFAPDTFGHVETMPMLLSGCGMSFHAHQRPDRKSIHPELSAHKPDDAPPLRHWTYKDGSGVLDYHLPSEYTVWFEDKQVGAITRCIDSAQSDESLACFYGVGNHGGGPTIANIEWVKKYRNYQDEAGNRATLEFSRLDSYFAENSGRDLESYFGEMEAPSSGCFSMDTQLKKAHYQGEQALLRAEKLCAMAVLLGTMQADGIAAKFEDLWKKVLFNQFHDILCGTSIKPARDRAVVDCGYAVSGAAELENRAVQAMVNAVDTSGEGFPLFLFNSGSQRYEGPVEIEVPWFCKAHLTILDDNGNQIPYQRVKTMCTMIHYNLGGLRRLVFRATLPPFGYAVYRLIEKEPGYDTYMGAPWVAGGLPICENPHIESGAIGRMDEDALPPEIDNGVVKVSFSLETGLPNSLTELGTGFQAINQAGAWLELLADGGNSWGWSPGQLAESGERLRLVELRLMENGSIRKVIKAVCTCEGVKAEILYTLYQGDARLHVEMRLFHARSRAMLMLRIPLNGRFDKALAQIPYGATLREEKDALRLMHGFLDITGADGGIAIHNDGCYSYKLWDSCVDIPLFRSGIYAQGNPKGWFSEHADFDHADMGRIAHRFTLSPHKEPVDHVTLYRDAETINQPPVMLLDTYHDGKASPSTKSVLSCSDASVVIGAAKISEDDGIPAIRLFNLSEDEKSVKLNVLSGPVDLRLPPNGLATVKIGAGHAQSCDLIEKNK